LIGAGCAFAFSAQVPILSRAPAKTGTIWPRHAHSVLPPAAMRPLNAPVRGAGNPFAGRSVQSEKHVLIHGAELARFKPLAQ
jgi:hypothetical protein